MYLFNILFSGWLALFCDSLVDLTWHKGGQHCIAWWRKVLLKSAEKKNAVHYIDVFSPIQRSILNVYLNVGDFTGEWLTVEANLAEPMLFFRWYSFM